jgi:hypothetical protein
MLHLITLVTHTHSRLLCTKDRPVAEAFTCTGHNIHNRQTSMSPARFEPETLASEQAYAPERAAICLWEEN